MTKKQAIKETIEHWKRMIAWAEKQNEGNRVIMFNIKNIMEDELKES